MTHTTYRLCAVAVALFMVAGCGDVGHLNWDTKPAAASEPAQPELQSNIIRVHKFFPPSPWLSFSGDGTGRAEGVRCTVYLEGPNGPQGVFGDGTIVVSMFEIVPQGRGREEAVKIHEWELSPDEAAPWRAKHKTALGWGYGLRLQWPDELAVYGKQVAFVIRYVRTDGRVVGSSRQVLKVPVPNSTGPRLS